MKKVTFKLFKHSELCVANTFTVPSNLSTKRLIDMFQSWLKSFVDNTNFKFRDYDQEVVAWID